MNNWIIAGWLVAACTGSPFLSEHPTEGGQDGQIGRMGAPWHEAGPGTRREAGTPPSPSGTEAAPGRRLEAGREVGTDATRPDAPNLAEAGGWDARPLDAPPGYAPEVRPDAPSDGPPDTEASADASAPWCEKRCDGECAEPMNPATGCAFGFCYPCPSNSLTVTTTCSRTGECSAVCRDDAALDWIGGWQMCACGTGTRDCGGSACATCPACPLGLTCCLPSGACGCFEGSTCVAR